MKKLLLFTVTFLNITFGQWTVEWENTRPLPDGVTMNNLQFIDSTTGWIPCSNGYILKTTNEGLDWGLVNTNTNSYLRSVFFIDSQTGWVAGNNNTILKTVDGGNTWTPQNTGQPANSALGYVKFFNANVGYIVGGYDAGEKGMNFTSYDKGKSWITNTNGDRSWFDTVYYNERSELVAEIFDYTTDERMKLKSEDNGNSWITKGEARGKWLRKITLETESEIKGVSVDFRAVTPICLKTTDGGNTWIEKTALSSGPAFFTDENTGYVILNSEDFLYKTSNGGDNWNEVFHSVDWSGLWELFFTDNDHGWIGGHEWSGGWRTTDGGNTWLDYGGGDLDNIDAIFFLNQDEGWVASTTRHGPWRVTSRKTTDGGFSFSTYFQHFTPRYMSIYSLYYTASNSGWAIAENGKLMKTNENGDFKIFPFFGTEAFIGNIHFINSSIGWCSDIEVDNSSGQTIVNIWKTSNSGKYWYLQNEGYFACDFNEIFFYDEYHGWAKSSCDGILLITTDGGNSWQDFQLNNDLKNFFFINNLVGWAYEGGSIYKSTNSGETWEYQYSGSDGINSFFFLDQNNGWAGGNNGLILYTTNGGTNWNTQTSNTTNNLNAIKFLGTTGLAVGSNGTILKSTNNGNVWTSLSGGTINNLFDVEMVDVNNIWSVGASGTILHTTNGGNNWDIEESNTTVDLYDVGFENINEGWATGYNDVLLKYEGSVPVELTSLTAVLNNTNVELSWTTASEINNLGFYIERKINNEWQSTGFVEGNGTTTEVHSYLFSDDISEIKSDFIYYRLKQTDFDGTYEYSETVEVTNNLIPEEYLLYQNYPNPFNPTTSIQYQIPQDGVVTLKIYDILGNEVKTLVNEPQLIGRYTINFDASDLASGTYIYQVKVNDFISTKKMILMK